MSIYDSELYYGVICDELFGGDEEAMQLVMRYDSREDELRERFEAYGTDAPYFAEIARMRIIETKRRKRMEHQFIAAFKKEVILVLDEFIPVSQNDAEDLYREEDDLDRSVMESEARDLVNARVKLAERSGLLPPPHFVRRRWYVEEINALSEAYEATIVGDV